MASYVYTIVSTMYEHSYMTLYIVLLTLWYGTTINTTACKPISTLCHGTTVNTMAWYIALSTP